MEPEVLENLHPKNPPVWKEFPIGQIYVDPEYQQPFDQKWGDQLADNWQPDAAGSLLLSVHDDGRAATPDGQHRLYAMRKKGITHWPCECHYGLTFEQEADLFLTRNTRKVPHIIAKFRARVAKKEPKALEIKRIMREYGVQIGFRDARIDSPFYNCVAAIEKSFDADLLEETIQILEICWSNHGRIARDKMVVDGITLFLFNFIDDQNFNINHAIDRIGKLIVLPKAKAHARSAATATRTSQAYQLAKLLLEAYNKGKQTRGLPAIAIDRF